jgi:hypothetical protein
VFRQITVRNWTERDPINENFAIPGKFGMRLMAGNDWAGLFLGVACGSRTESVQDLFLVARNTLPYGHFFSRSLLRLLRSFRGVRFLKRVYKIDLLVR